MIGNIKKGTSRRVKLAGALLVVLLFSFKFKLVNTVGSGIRLDDFLIAFVLFLYVLSTLRLLKITISPPIKYMLLFILWNIVSAIYNSVIERVDIVTSLLFSLRHLEYLLLFVVGFILGKTGKSLQACFKSYLFFCVILVFFQVLGLVGTVSAFGTSRGFVANTGGPWEFAAVCAFLTIYFFFNTYKYLWVLPFLLLVGTQSRITTLAVLLVIVSVLSYRVFKKDFARFLLYLCLLSILLVALIGTYMYFNLNVEVINRIGLLFTQESLSAIQALYYNMQPVSSQTAYYDATYASGFSDVVSLGGDTSSMVRFSRWIVLIRSVFADAWAPIIGLGPSFAFLAVDGNYVRIFAETGFVGLALFFLFLYASFKNIKGDMVLTSYLVVLCITALFIDIFTTYKAMLLFWAYLGWRNGFKKAYFDKNIRVS